MPLAARARRPRAPRARPRRLEEFYERLGFGRLLREQARRDRAMRAELEAATGLRLRHCRWRFVRRRRELPALGERWRPRLRQGRAGRARRHAGIGGARPCANSPQPAPCACRRSSAPGRRRPRHCWCWSGSTSVPRRRAGEPLLGEQLARLHRDGGRQFGWHRDNTIGATPQRNDWTADWCEFFARHRLGVQLELAEQQRPRRPLARARAASCASGCDAFFDGYRPQPRCCTATCGAATGPPRLQARR